MNASSNEPFARAINILLVEDDAPTSWRLQDALSKAGYQVRAAGTLGEARADARARRSSFVRGAARGMTAARAMFSLRI